MQILAGDVGGTKTDLLLARVDPESAAPVELRSARLASADHRDLAAAIDAFFAGDRPHLDAAAFGIAGPIVDGVCRTTNLPWVIDGDVLAAALALPRPALRLLNDFHALALGVDGLAPSQLALAGDDPACVATIDRFLRIYGAEAGNLALKVLPSGGLYVAGGIAPRLLPLLRQGPFLEALLAKGRMRPLLERLRVAVVTEPRVGLLGAARAAAELLRAPAG